MLDRPAGYPVMRFEGLIGARILKRINRFAVQIDVEGRTELAHLHDPGRLLEIVYPGNEVLVRRTDGPKLKWRIEFGKINGRYVLIDSGLHSDIARRFLPEGAVPEVRVGRKRIDFRYGDDYIEVKGCTLMANGIAMFPDAPTKRGLEHLKTLETLASSGYRSHVMMIITRDDVRCFYPNFETDPKFAEAFLRLVPAYVKAHFLTFGFDGLYLRYAGSIGLCADVGHGTNGRL
ncbi:DNA/RNA nuclease SfsA [Thermoplasma acidophilum]|nr:DNA/RNA nuclease SfsA [Thermoplasma acidophilum]